MNEVQRVVIAARLSVLQRDGREGLGIETQDKLAREWCDHESLIVVETAADTKSGTSAPWDRKNLRPWVTKPEKMAQYDAIVAYKMDRLSRGTQEDFTRIEHWAVEHGKKLIIVNGPQFPARPGNESDYWQWHAEKRAARTEWESGRERIMRARTELQEQGKLVGRPPFGYDVMGEKYNRKLVKNALGKWVKRIFDKYLKGGTLNGIAAWLNAKGVPTGNGQKTTGWSATGVRNILLNPTYIGRHCEKEKDSKTGKYTGRYGKMIHRCDPLVDASVFRQVGEILANKPKRGPRTENSPMLSGALDCMLCGVAPMYRQPPHEKDATYYRYYRCAGKMPLRRSTCHNNVRGDILESIVSARMALMTEPMMKRERVSSHDFTAEELENVQYDLEHLRAQYKGRPREEFIARQTELLNDEERLTAELKEAGDDGWKDVPTGETYAEKWARLPDKERGEWLQEKNIKIYAFTGSNDGDKERLIAAIGKPGCPITRLEDMPPKINGIYVLMDLTPLMEVTEAEDEDWEEVMEEELDRLAAYGRSAWNVGDPALVLVLT